MQVPGGTAVPRRPAVVGAAATMTVDGSHTACCTTPFIPGDSRRKAGASLLRLRALGRCASPPACLS
jgi:hypothetical protein